MTTVMGPNGEEIEFPEGTPRAEMERAMRQRFGTRPNGRPPGYSEFAGATANLAHGLTLGANDEITGAVGALTDAGGALMRGRNPLPALRGGYEREAGRTRAYRDQFLQERPLAGNFAQGTGAALPVLATGSATLAPQATGAAARGAGGLFRQSAEAATVGAGVGGAYGFNAQDGTLPERLGAASQGAMIGGGLGAVAPTAVNAARSVGGLFGGAARRIPTPDPNAVGAMGGNLRLVPPAPPQPPRVPSAAANTIERLSSRAGQGLDDLEQAFTAARADPQGRVTADILGDPGVRTLRSIAQSPGKTGQLAADTARRRFHAAPERVLGQLNERLGVSETPTSALKALGRQYEETSAQNYAPLFRGRSTPTQQALYTEMVEPLLADPVMQQAIQRAERIFRRDARLGLVSGAPDQNLARYLHYVKMGLDDTIGAARRDATGIQSTEMRGVMELRNRFVNALDPGDGSPAIIPGYAAARQRWGTLAEAEEALEEGGRFLALNSAEVRARMAEMSPFAQHHARIGLASAVADRIGLRGSVIGNKNIADVFGAPEIQARLRAAFDDPEQAAAFLDTLNTQNQLMRNASQWGGGSQTFSNQAHGEDQAVSMMVDAGLSAARGDVAGFAGRQAQRLGNFVSGGALERANDKAGAALLTPIDEGPEAAAFADAVLEELRRRQIRRAASARVARGAAAGGGVAGNRKRT